MGHRAAIFNGIRAKTGEYCSLISKPSSEEVLASLEFLRREPERGLESRFMTSTELSSSGWSIVLPDRVGPEVAEALAPLIEHRRRQCGDRFKVRHLECRASKVYRTSPAAADTDPYYVLLVGSPRNIPFSAEAELARRHAVGRIYFSTPEQYATYANSVVEVENKGVGRVPGFTTFATCHQDDRATESSTYGLLVPVVDNVTSFLKRGGFDWRVNTSIGENAQKSRLTSILSSAQSPTLLLIGTHGVLDTAHDRVPQVCGTSLLCQDWPGPLRATGAIPKNWIFSAADLDRSTTVKGTIVFSLSSYGIGSDAGESFPLPWAEQGKEAASEPTIPNLPQRLLSHPMGGAIAVIGQRDRLLTSSFEDSISRPQAQIFAEVVKSLAFGIPVGHVMRCFRESYLALESETRRGLFKPGSSPEAKAWNRLVVQMAARNAQTFGIFGDPAVCTATLSGPRHDSPLTA